MTMDTPSIEVQKLTAKIESLRETRNTELRQYEQRLAYLDGQVKALEELLNPEAQPEPEASEKNQE